MRQCPIAIAPPNPVIFNVITTPPTKPATVLDNGDMEVIRGKKRTDTVKPIVDTTCSDSAIRRGVYCDTIMKYIDTTAYMKKLRDSSRARTTEAGFSIRTIGSDTPYTYKAIDYVDAGQAQTVALYISDYTVATVHLHTYKLDDSTVVVPSPSPRDYWSLITNTADTAKRKRRFQALFTVYGGPNKEQFALMPTDTSIVREYYYDTSKPVSITDFIDTRDSIPDPEDTSKNIRNPYYNSWVGTPKDKKTYLGIFWEVHERLKNSKYPKEYLETYASLIVAQKAGLPVKLLMRDTDGRFKELKFVEQMEGGKTKYIIKICK